VSNSALIKRRFPAIELLSHYDLGQVYERTGKRDQAINERQANFSLTLKVRARGGGGLSGKK
jgi:hypothetical protein